MSKCFPATTPPLCVKESHQTVSYLPVAVLVLLLSNTLANERILLKLLWLPQWRRSNTEPANQPARNPRCSFPTNQSTYIETRFDAESVGGKGRSNDLFLSRAQWVLPHLTSLLVSKPISARICYYNGRSVVPNALPDPIICVHLHE